jgi:hypothetical protein
VFEIADPVNDLRFPSPAPGSAGRWLRAYQKLCARAVKRVKAEGYEQHHIFPRSWGGDDSPENLVYLTTREHYIAHRLLARAFPTDTKMLYAAWMMAQRGTIRTSTAYARLREQITAASTARMAANYADPEFVAALRSGHAKWLASPASKEVLRKNGEAHARRNPELTLGARMKDPAFAEKARRAHAEAVSIPVVRVETGEVFPSAAAAAAWSRENGFAKACASGINSCARNTSTRRTTAAGSRWQQVGGKPPPALNSGANRTQPGVLRVSTGEVFVSAYAAAKAIGNTKQQANIFRVCRAGVGCAAGEKWRFSDGSTPEARVVTRASLRPVRCVDTGTLFASLTDAAAWCRKQGHAKACTVVIGRCANPGLPGRKTAYGYRWEFFYL